MKNTNYEFKMFDNFAEKNGKEKAAAVGIGLGAIATALAASLYVNSKITKVVYRAADKVYENIFSK